MKIRLRYIFAFMIVGTTPLAAWNYEGHRMVNELALASLPEEFPAFVHTAGNAERVAFLSGEPDRWRNNSELPIKHYNSVDHYLDIEHLTHAGLDPKEVSDLRYVFAVEYAEGRISHAENFTKINPAKNKDHTGEWAGFFPWAIVEYYGKLKSAFSYLKTFEQAGTEEEIANAQANVIYIMGVMGHYVGDGSQPLHTTVHHNGWTGENPDGYTKWPGIHSWLDGGFITKAGITTELLRLRVVEAQPIDVTVPEDGRNPMFIATMDYLLAQNALVEPFYVMEKADVFKAANVNSSSEGRDFIEEQLLKGGQMLGSIWLTAWKNASEDSYLAKQLAAKRQQVDSQP